ncbi:MAG: dTDP-4-dehydrorhamnose 3,5-epimerase [Alsobacter sp.]
MTNLSVSNAGLPGVTLITPRRHGDDRGYFSEVYSRPALAAYGIDSDFLQDNQSLSKAPGTLRGLHFQRPPFAQAKLVRVLRGAVFDVAVDIRRGSQTYGQWCGATLTADGGEQLFVPRGFAHGFVTLEENTEVAYKVDNVYSRDHEGGIAWDDPEIGIAWPWGGEVALSAKDRMLPLFAALVSPFPVSDYAVPSPPHQAEDKARIVTAA